MFYINSYTLDPGLAECLDGELIDTLQPVI